MMDIAEEQGAARKVINIQEEARGRYEILRVVNRGGMGEIALGRVRGAKGFEKLVVLKRLRADAERDDHMAMFDVEQELMSRIEHPNIVKVFDQPVIDNTPYLAMEYVRGRNLDQIIRQAKDANDRLNLAFSLTVVSEVLRGLAFVHRLKDNEGKALGVVHQDITPSNIMVSFFGEVKITDFGISYVTSRDGGLRRGVLKGKPRYVAPEVLAGKRVNNRADIYGVGLVLFEMLTQNALFARATVKETLAAVARGELPDFSEQMPNLGEGVLRIFTQSLAKDPAERYRTAEEMGADVLAELAKLGGAISPARLGYIVRQHFRDDPDVPEVDPAFEAALSAEAQPVLPSSFRPPDLSQTLTELDRLLGPRQSTDLFTLPPDLKSELAGIEDMDPFLALTPIPDFVWDAPNDAELLRRASEEYGGALPGMAAPSVVREPPPLAMRDELGEVPSFDMLSFDSRSKPPVPMQPSLRTPPRPVSPAPRTPSTSRGPTSSTSARPMPSSSTSNPMPRPATSSGLRAPDVSNGNGAENGARPRMTRSSSSTTEGQSPTPLPLVRPASSSQLGAPLAPPVARERTPVPTVVEAPKAEVKPRAPSVGEVPGEKLEVRKVHSVTTTDAEVPDRRNIQFWMGLGIGLALGVTLGAVMSAMFGG